MNIIYIPYLYYIYIYIPRLWGLRAQYFRTSLMNEETRAQRGKATCPMVHIELAAKPALRTQVSQFQIQAVHHPGVGGRRVMGQMGAVPYPMTRTLHPCSPWSSREDLEKLQRRKEPLDFGQRLGDRTERWGWG